MRLVALIGVLAFSPGLAMAAVHHARPPARHPGPRHALPARHMVLSMSAGDSAASPAAYHALPVAEEGQMRLAIDRRLGHSAWIGSLGYHRGETAAPLDPHAVNSAAAVQLGTPDSTVGAKVSLPF